MRTIRRGVFETNSSSTHSLILYTDTQEKLLSEGKLFVDFNSESLRSAKEIFDEINRRINEDIEYYKNRLNNDDLANDAARKASYKEYLEGLETQKELFKDATPELLERVISKTIGQIEEAREELEEDSCDDGYTEEIFKKLVELCDITDCEHPILDVLCRQNWRLMTSIDDWLSAAGDEYETFENSITLDSGEVVSVAGYYGYN